MSRRQQLLLGKSLYLSSLMVYAASFFLPTLAIESRQEREVLFGYQDFGFGLLAPIVFPSFLGLLWFLTWLAHPVFWIAILYAANGRATKAAVAGIMAALLATGFFLLSEDRQLILIGHYVQVMRMEFFTLAAIIKFATASSTRPVS